MAIRHVEMEIKSENCNIFQKQKWLRTYGTLLMFGVVWDHKDPYQAVYHVCSHFRPISVCLCKKSIFTLKRGYFRLFFTKLPILAEYASAIEYSMGPEKIFSDQDFRYLQILVYGIFISFLVIELQKKRYSPVKNGSF